MGDWVITYYKRTHAEPVKTRRVKGLELSSVQAMADEWREWTNGYAVIEPVNEPVNEPESTPAGITDHRGTRHLVAITHARHDFWTASGELAANCACGWSDHHPYIPGGEDFARLKLQYRATDHLSRKTKKREEQTNGRTRSLRSSARALRHRPAYPSSC